MGGAVYFVENGVFGKPFGGQLSESMKQPTSGVIGYSFVGLRAHGHSDQHLEGF